MHDLEQFKATFFQECDELLGELERHVSDLSAVTEPAEILNAAFRAIHSIKGGAGMFGFSRLVAFAHIVESALDQARGARLQTNAEFVEAVLHASDILSDLAESARTGAPIADDYEVSSARQLTSLMQGSGAPFSSDVRAPISTALDHSADSATRTTYRIRYAPGPDIFRRGIEPLLMVRNLSELGALSTEADPSAIPEFMDLDPAVAYLRWTFNLETSKPRQAIHDVFEFNSEACRLEIDVVETSTDASVALSRNKEPAAAAKETWAALDTRGASSIRVELDRIERLVNLVGEISIAQSMVLQHLDQSIVDSNPHLFRAITQLLQLSRGLQDGVMAIRAQPIRSIFSRMPRIVRDAAHNADKKALLELSGEDTEIDKTIIEQISDPLMHVVRNAIDHGVESVAERRAAGKPDAGLIRLSAEQKGGRIVVEVSDDGRGIDRAAVRRRAVELNLIAEDEAQSDHDIDNLVFRPGLSTAKTVSSLSGRGVGMDVVHQNIQKLGGRVAIRSTPGVGTTTSIILPLTLAVLDSMLVRSGSESYLVPLANIVECIVTSHDDVSYVPGTGDFVAVRGRQIRVFSLAQRLGFQPSNRSERSQILLVEIEDGGIVGLIVDEICGHRQVVIKSIRDHFEHIAGLAGATILGDGCVAFILDVDEIAALASETPQRPTPNNDFEVKQGAIAA
ncbi:MAG: chemotaxis protein CheA [Hyphomicrobium sp.]